MLQQDGFTLNYTSAFDDANYGLNSGLGENTDDADSDRGGHSIGFENGGTVNTTSAQLNYLYGASQIILHPLMLTLLHSTICMET